MNDVIPFPRLADAEGRTEGTFSRRVARLYGAHVRYVAPWRKWLVWDGRRWSQDDGPILDGFIRETARQLFLELGATGDDMRDADLHDAVRHAKAMNTARGKNATRDLLASEPGLAVGIDELDADPLLLNVENGVIDLRTGKVMPHSPKLLQTKLAPVVFDEGAACPNWRRFLNEIFDGDEALIRYVQRAAGYALTGDVREHKLFLAHGCGANGKTTFIEAVAGLLGDYAVTAMPDLLMVKADAHPTELAILRGHRFVACSETEDGRRFAESRVKLLTGGDTITARRMREDPWQFRPSHKLWLSTNHKPRLRGTDTGIRRRLHLVPFTVSFPPDRQNKHLPRQLRDERQGILQWAVAGALQWQANGLGEPDAVRTATSDYLAAEDVIGRFIAERCIEAPACKVRAGELYDVYRKWCDEQGEYSVTMTRFGIAIEERGFAKRTSNGVWYDGIGLEQLEHSIY